MTVDEKERLEPEEIAAGGLLASSHLHRYELAADLCAGRPTLDLCCGTGYGSALIARQAERVHGVDVSDEAISAARAALPGDVADRVTFEQADALEFLRAQPQGRYEAIVCFEGIEHVPDPQAVAKELLRLTEGGARLLLSFPNSRGMEEDNRFHVTDFGYEEMLELVAPFPSPVIVEQYLAEGSLLVPAGERPDDVRAKIVRDNGGAPEWANHWIVAIGVAAAELEQARGRFELAAAENQNRYIQTLERANAELWRTNLRMGRGWLGIHDAAAGAALRRFEDARDEARRWKAEAEKWEKIADGNDWARERAERMLQARRYRAADRLAAGVSAIPGASVARRALRRLRGS